MNIKVSGKALRVMTVFILLFLSVLVPVLLTGYGLDSKSIGTKCALCHVMKPEYLTWNASSHKMFGCNECHGGSGITGKAQRGVEAAKKLYRFITKTYTLPVQVSEQISDQKCVKCHSFNREITSATDIIVPHRKHATKGVPCITCHKNVVHGGIALRTFSEQDLSRVDNITQLTNLSLGDTLPKMDLCMECHETRNVTVACAACHSGDFLPDSHKEKTFMRSHGELAAKDLNYCDTCHSFIKPIGAAEAQNAEGSPVEEAMNEITGTSIQVVIAYAKNNQYCSDCHKKLPLSHDEMWPYKHGEVAKKDPVNCEACHGSGPKRLGASGRGACAQCHPSKHSEFYKYSHPVPIPKPLTRFPEYCFDCHRKTQCIKCHGRSIR